LREKQALEINDLAVAFTLAIGSAKVERAQTAHSTPYLPLVDIHARPKASLLLNANSDVSDDEEDQGVCASTGSRRRKHRSCFYQGCKMDCTQSFGASATADEDSASDHDDAEPLCSIEHAQRCSASSIVPTACLRTSLKVSEENGHSASRTPNSRRASSGSRDANASRRTKEHERRQQMEHTDDKSDVSLNAICGQLIHKHVKVVGLTNKAEFNGERGTVTAFDTVKRRYRVRLDGDHLVLAFKAQNLQRVK